MCTCIQSFDSLVPYLDLPFYLENLELLSMPDQNIFTFLSRIQFKCARSAFSPGYGYNSSKASNVLRFFNFQNTLGRLFWVTSI